MFPSPRWNFFSTLWLFAALPFLSVSPLSFSVVFCNPFFPFNQVPFTGKSSTSSAAAKTTMYWHLWIRLSVFFLIYSLSHTKSLPLLSFTSMKGIFWRWFLTSWLMTICNKYLIKGLALLHRLSAAFPSAFHLFLWCLLIFKLLKCSLVWTVPVTLLTEMNPWLLPCCWGVLRPHGPGLALWTAHH